MANKELFARGATELLVLSVLYRQDMYTYQIKQEIKEQSNDLFNLSESILYSILYKYAKEGYVSEWTQERGKEYYLHCLEEYKKTSYCLNKLLCDEE